MDAHELVSAVKAMALDLGRTPTMQEFASSMRGGHYALRRLGGYTVLLAQAGLDPQTNQKKQRIDNSVFEKDIEQHLREYKPREPLGTPVSKLLRGLFLGDIHFPFSNDKLVEAAVRFAEKEQPEIIVQGGDLYDHISHNRFPRSHNLFSPREEQESARNKAVTLWAEIRKACPRARLVQCWGNHDLRPLKRVLEAYPEAEDWVEQAVRRLMTFEGVETLSDYRQELILPGNVMVHHGYRSQLGQHRDYVQMNAIVHHTHLGGVVFKRLRDTTLWELNAGYMADPHAKGLTYTNQKMTNWTPGWGWTDEYGPRFIPA
jgi:predicted phosphodiesterase